MTTRTLTASRPGPVAFTVDLPAGDIKVITDPSRTLAEVTVTARGEGPAVHAAVRDAVLRWEESTGTLTARVCPPTGGATITGTTQTVIGNHASTIVQSYGDIPAGVTVTGAVISGDSIVNLAGGSVTVNGVEITGGGIVAGGRVKITAHLPEGSTVAALTRSAPLACSGEFAEVTFTSTSGDLSAGGVGALRAKTVSGDISAAVVDGAAVIGSVSGDLYLGRADDVTANSTSGDITVADFAGRADLSAVSGDIRVRATEGGTVSARSVSGDVTVTATETALAEGLTTRATSRTGHVTTPDHTPTSPTASRARRPRRTTGGA